MTLDTKQRVRALSLLSGGLDSQLAVCLLRDQGVYVEGVSFESPFFHSDLARKAAGELGIALHVVKFTPDIVSLINDPPHGFGSCMNPCIDCHARMLKRAGEMMEDMGFDFLSTGEVLDERPMSQNRRSLDIVSNDSTYGPWIVRPLSGALLPPTEPEKRGWLDRTKLGDIHGRSRKRQFAMAEKYGLHDYPTPAGGCRLTEPSFCMRLRDLKDHEGLNGERSLLLLRFGRHFRVSSNTKIIVGRNEAENAVLEGNAELYDLVLKPEGLPGPTCLLPITAIEDEVQLGAGICARYSDHKNGSPVTVRVRSATSVRRIQVAPAEPASIEALRVG